MNILIIYYSYFELFGIGRKLKLILKENNVSK